MRLAPNQAGRGNVVEETIVPISQAGHGVYACKSVRERLSQIDFKIRDTAGVRKCPEDRRDNRFSLI